MTNQKKYPRCYLVSPYLVIGGGEEMIGVNVNQIQSFQRRHSPAQGWSTAIETPDGTYYVENSVAELVEILTGTRIEEV